MAVLRRRYREVSREVRIDVTSYPETQTRAFTTFGYVVWGRTSRVILWTQDVLLTHSCVSTFAYEASLINADVYESWIHTSNSIYRYIPRHSITKTTTNATSALCKSQTVQVLTQLLNQHTPCARHPLSCYWYLGLVLKTQCIKTIHTSQFVFQPTTYTFDLYIRSE